MTPLLSLPPFRFANEVDNLTGQAPAALIGTTFSAGANNADGSVVSLLSALAFDVHYLVIALGGFNLSATDCSALVDIVTDPAGGTSWASFIDDLVAGFTATQTAGITGLDTVYAFPVYIKSGSSVGVRARNASSGALNFGGCAIWAYGNPTRPDMWWCGQKVETLGVNAATSKGTNITSGSSGAAGTFTSVGSTTSGRYGAIQLGINGSDSSMLALGYYWQIGIGSAKIPGTPTLYHSGNSIESIVKTGWGTPIWCDIPQGTQLQVMGSCSGTQEINTVALYGVH